MKVKSHAGLTKRLGFLLKAAIAVLVASIIANFYSLYYLIMREDVELTDIPDIILVIAAIIGASLFIVVLVTTITFFMWVYRSNKNLGILSGESMKHSPAWSVWSWFIPIVNLFVPYRVIKEIWNVSYKNEAKSHSIIILWWSTFVISDLLSLLLAFLPERDAYGEVLENTTIYILFIVSCILTLDVVTKIGKAYSRNIVEPN